MTAITIPASPVTQGRWRRLATDWIERGVTAAYGVPPPQDETEALDLDEETRLHVALACAVHF